MRRGAAQAGYPHMDIVSGAGHDACYVSRVAPTAMVFVPCKAASATTRSRTRKADDLTAGCNVLLNALLETADAP